MTLWQPDPRPPAPSLDPPPISRAERDRGGRTGNKSTFQRNYQDERAAEVRAFIRASSRLTAQLREEERHEVDHRVRRLTRRGIRAIIMSRAAELGDAWCGHGSSNPKRG